jgi:glycine cleavage system transcriptional repressor
MSTPSPQQLVISTVGADRPGLVATMCEIISEHNGNIDDSTMTLLGGQFAMIYVATFPDADSTQDFHNACQHLKESHNLHFESHLLDTPYSAETMTASESHPHKYLLSVGGYDRTGITYAFSKKLADFDINITDVNAHRINGEEGTVYMLAIEMDAPRELDEDAFKASLDTLGQAMSLDVRLRSMDAMIL